MFSDVGCADRVVFSYCTVNGTLPHVTAFSDPRPHFIYWHAMPHLICTVFHRSKIQMCLSCIATSVFLKILQLMVGVCNPLPHLQAIYILTLPHSWVDNFCWTYRHRRHAVRFSRYIKRTWDSCHLWIKKMNNWCVLTGFLSFGVSFLFHSRRIKALVEDQNPDFKQSLLHPYLICRHQCHHHPLQVRIAWLYLLFIAGSQIFVILAITVPLAFQHKGESQHAFWCLLGWNTVPWTLLVQVLVVICHCRFLSE